MKITKWKLAAKSGRRFRAGHPWVFANELTTSPKGHTSGAPVELFDESGQFLARGYGNPHSLICFRSLSRQANILDPWSEQRLAEKVIKAARYRRELGRESFSYRMVFGEADDLPGLIIDRFYSSGSGQQILVIQVLTAGMEEAIKDWPTWLESWCEKSTGIDFKKTGFVLRRDVGSRKLEGLEIKAPEVIQFDSTELKSFLIDVLGYSQLGVTQFSVDLIEGQKTGFFFDQSSNVEALANQLRNHSKSNLTVLDLFCYVGQWSAQVSRLVTDKKISADCHLVDGSSAALRLASENVKRSGGQPHIYERDIMSGLSGIPDCDVVVCDPPAFIKSKKDHAAGLKGYLKVNTMALAKVKPGGWFVSCSCSHHLSDVEFTETLRNAESKAQRTVRWISRGVQGPDHPISLQFPEGYYLKAWLGRVIS